MKFIIAGTALLIAALAHATTDLSADGGERDLVRVPTDGTTCCDLGYACVHDNGLVCIRPYRLDSPNWAGLCPPGSSPADCACENTKTGNRRDDGCGTPKICAGPDGEPLTVTDVSRSRLLKNV